MLQTSIARLLRHLSRSRFARDTRGTVVIDTLSAILLMSLGASAFFAFWEAYQVQNRVQKATYTVSDLISRQRGTTLTRGFLDGMERTAEFLMMDDQNAIMRVSQVRRTAGTATTATGLTVDWSYSPCGARTAITTATINTIRSKLPLIDLGAALVVVEFDVGYDAGMSEIGFGQMNFTGFLSSLPRFEQQFSLTGSGTTTCL
jgi:Flp pilus assembly protein TadG